MDLDRPAAGRLTATLADGSFLLLFIWWEVVCLAWDEKTVQAFHGEEKRSVWFMV